MTCSSHASARRPLLEIMFTFIRHCHMLSVVPKRRNSRCGLPLRSWPLVRFADMGNLAGRRYPACDVPIAEISRAIFQDKGRLKLISSSDYNVFAHLTAEKSDIYRAVLSVFVEAKARFVIHLRPADLERQLAQQSSRYTDATAVEVILHDLVAWGNLEAHPRSCRRCSFTKSTATEVSEKKQ